MWVLVVCHAVSEERSNLGLGQHTREALRTAGLAENEVDALFDDGVAYDEHPNLTTRSQNP